MIKKVFSLFLISTMMVTVGCSGGKGSKEVTSVDNALVGTYYKSSSNKDVKDKWYFEEDGTFHSEGHYGYTKKSEGEKIIITNTMLETGELALEYSIAKKEGMYEITLMQNGKEMPQDKRDFILKSGMDGFDDSESFRGTYIDTEEGIEYIFDSDGIIQVNSGGTYVIDGEKIIFDMDGSKQPISTKYKLSEDGSKLTIDFGYTKEELMKE